MSFDYTVTTSKSIDESVATITAALKEQGFGVLGVLDFQAILEQKGVQLGKSYKLLEVCNPHSAKTAIDKDPRIGLLLPCTIAVYSDAGRTRVSLLRPTHLLNLAPEAQLTELGNEIEAKLKTAIDQATP